MACQRLSCVTVDPWGYALDGPYVAKLFSGWPEAHTGHDAERTPNHVRNLPIPMPNPAPTVPRTVSEPHLRLLGWLAWQRRCLRRRSWDLGAEDPVTPPDVCVGEVMPSAVPREGGGTGRPTARPPRTSGRPPCTYAAARATLAAPLFPVGRRGLALLPACPGVLPLGAGLRSMPTRWDPARGVQPAVARGTPQPRIRPGVCG